MTSIFALARLKNPVSVDDCIESLIYTRNQLREVKQFQLADEIRAKLGELGIALEDTPSDTIVKHKR